VRLAFLTTALVLFRAAPVHAQHLRDEISQLFIFGGGDEPLFLGGSASPNNPQAIQLHGSHFIPSAVASNGTVISFLTNSIGGSVANLPVSASSGGTTFSFQGGVPVRTSTSTGPIFAERAQTLGRGRVLATVTRSGLQFKTFRGVDLSNTEFTFTHANVDFPGCNQLFNGNCVLMGVPAFENDVIDLNLDLNVNLTVTSFLLTYGITDRIDFGVVVPLVNTSLTGNSAAQIVPFGPPPVLHFFGGTPTNPVLTASRFVEGSATGLGDVIARVKINLHRGDPLSIAVLADTRFPTGSEEDLLGSGAWGARGLGIVSAHFGPFSPHANVGYAYRGGEFETDAFLATAGFDHLLTSWATLAVDLISEFQVGSSPLQVPAPVQFQAPYQRTVVPSEIPDRRDDLINGSIGVKLTAFPGFTFIANTIWPLNSGGLRPDVIWTAGAEYNF
jgi:hypothetical protein